MNIEICSTIKAVKYLYKYIYTFTLPYTDHNTSLQRLIDVVFPNFAEYLEHTNTIANRAILAPKN